jgi:hypothetical protein
LDELRAGFAAYATGRAALLAALDLPESNRDPLAEFSERVVAALLVGEPAPSRVQRGWDVMASGRRIQVKYLANPSGRWVNEHHIRLTDEMEDYAIVFFEALLPVRAIVIAGDRLLEVADALGKRHGETHAVLQLTRRNYLQIVGDPARFAGLGVRVFDLGQQAVAPDD